MQFEEEDKEIVEEKPKEQAPIVIYVPTPTENNNNSNNNPIPTTPSCIYDYHLEN
ncbi:MAG: hypothetical protein LBD88_02755 [Candidatus Peribacteria bacterium]|nr:hypothetical protein [Candidatus Peribacteria bacterium]